MSEALSRALSDPGPHTVESLAEKLPAFPPHAIREALELLADQGVLERETTPEGAAQYRYVAPERYAQVNLDVVRDPAKQLAKRTR